MSRLAEASGRSAEEFLALDDLLTSIGEDADGRLAFQGCARLGRPSADAAQIARISESEDLTMQVEQLCHLAAFHASHPAFCTDTPFAWSG